jgi:hypothetical protein
MKEEECPHSNQSDVGIVGSYPSDAHASNSSRRVHM